MPRRLSYVLAAGLLTLLIGALAPPLGAQQGFPPPPPPPPPPPITATADNSGQSGQQTPAAPGTGVILGQVVDAATGRPVASASVTISGRPPVPIDAAAGRTGAAPAPSDPGRAFVNSEGRFVFRSLPKGLFGLTVSAPGYLMGAYGQARMSGPSRQVEIEDSAAVVKATIKLWKFASISGAVVDEFGEPAVGVEVRGLRRIMTAGKPRFSGFDSVVTDDRGLYRMALLTPGDYVITIPTAVINIPTSSVDAYILAAQNGTTAELSREYSVSGMPYPSPGGVRLGDQQLQFSTVRGGAAGIPVSLDGPIFTYQTVYHPSAATVAQATVITVAPGEEREGVNVQLRLAKTVRVSGTVTGPDGPVPNLGLRLAPLDVLDATDGGFETAVTATDGRGQFTFLAVPTGQYVLKMQRSPRASGGVMTMINGIATMFSGDGSMTAPSSEPTLWAQQPLTVGDTEIAGLNVALRTGVRLSGRIVFDGTTAPRPTPDRMSNASVYATPVDPSAGVSVTPARPDASGQFTTQQYVPGKYWMAVSGAFPQWTLKSVTAVGRDVMTQPLELSSTDVSDIVITYTDEIAEVAGTGRDTSGAPVADATLLAFPADYQSWITNGMSSRQSRTATVGKAGTFSMQNLPKGAYLVVAVSPDTAADLQDPKWIGKLAAAGTRFSMNPGEKHQVDLTVSRIR